MSIIYLDNAATSFPKPPQVVEAIVRFLTRVGANPGRSGHRLSVEAGRIVYETREALAELFGISDPLRIVFGHNATEMLNLVLTGFLRPGDHVITSSMEHNSVMRPLRALEKNGVEISVLKCSPEGLLDPVDLERAIRPSTRLIVLNHASNVTGTILPVREAGKLARQYGAYLLVDAAQTAGAHPIDVEADGIDFLAFTGHKSLLGPTGTGGLYIGPRVPLEELKPLKRGGTGSRSELEEQPDFLPDKYESGTLNAAGLAGLGAGVRFILERGVEEIRCHELRLTALLLEGLSSIERVRLYGPSDLSLRIGIVSFNVEGLEPSDVAFALDEEFGIMCRPGLHCAPSAHRTMGTFPKGTVRFSIGFFNTVEEVEKAIEAIKKIARR
ncbi:MAG: aminotransferase class V-fold PLP-dependent enzyme [Anaerolineae bacterium]|nr:aminotransferase class V-fold PLP-dependent enzyme [Anaerolineae bacterium]MDW8103082.1 aminotransferase class V-fold PLP-dependent enzyme [Anaerolineae bacterium]